MRRRERHVQEERLALIRANKVDGIVRDEIGEVALSRDRLAVQPQHGIGGGRLLDMVKIVHTAAKAVERMVEAVPPRGELVFVAEVPFAADRCDVAGVLEHSGKRARRDGKPQIVRLAEPDGIVIAADVADTDGALEAADALRIAARQQGGAVGLHSG